MFRFYIRKLFDQYCVDNELSKAEAAKQFGVSLQFLDRVMKNRGSCPRWLVKKFSQVFKIDEEIIGLVYGYYPSDWVDAVRTNPPLMREKMREILNALGKKRMKPKLRSPRYETGAKREPE